MDAMSAHCNGMPVYKTETHNIYEQDGRREACEKGNEKNALSAIKRNPILLGDLKPYSRR